MQRADFWNSACIHGRKSHMKERRQDEGFGDCHESWKYMKTEGLPFTVGGNTNEHNHENIEFLIHLGIEQ